MEVVYGMFTDVGVILIHNQPALPIAFAVQSPLDTLTDGNVFEAYDVHEVDHLLFRVGRRFC